MTPDTLPDLIDERRRTEDYAPYARLHARTERRLLASLSTFMLDLRRHDPLAQVHFIARHIDEMTKAWRASFLLGTQDYYQGVSATPHTWIDAALAKPDEQAAIDAMMRKQMLFYTPSVSKMAHEAQVALHDEERMALSEVVTLRSDMTKPLELWEIGARVRVGMQANLTWSGFQHGYVRAGTWDKAKPYIKLYWLLDPGARSHCASCPDVARKSPYDPPGGGYGSNVLRQTPGDGATECGARCRCDLTYGPPEDVDFVDWGGMWPVNAPLQEIWPEAFSPRDTISQWNIPLGLPREYRLTRAQIAALDQFRLAEAEWDRYRGNMPALPDMFDPRDWHLKMTWDRLTFIQRRALYRAMMALKDWQLAGGDKELEDFELFKKYRKRPSALQDRLPQEEVGP